MLRPAHGAQGAAADLANGSARRLSLIALSIGLTAAGLAGQSTVFVSRHADRYGTEPDPALTATGERQAEALGRMLADANVKHIYVTELLRTRQTAAPTARRAKVEPVVVKQDQFDELILQVRKTLRPGESTLVVGHRSTVPRIVKALSGQDIPPLTSFEYGRLAAVTLFPDGTSSVVTLRYGEEQPAAPAVVIEHATVFDSRTGSMEPERSILIENGRIRSIVRSGQPLEGSPGARSIDARGKFLIPGLIDSHVHLVHILSSARMTGDEILPLFLANGVTTVRDAGDETVAQKLVSRYAEAHPDLSPRIFLGSLLIDGRPAYHKNAGRTIDDPDDVPSFLDEMAAWGARTVKLYVGIERAVGRRVIEEAHRRGLFVAGHLGRYTAQEAVEDGIDGLEHIDSVLDFIAPPDEKRLPPPHRRQGLSAGEIVELRRRTYQLNAELDLGSARAVALIRLLAERKVMVDPTLTVTRNWLLLRDTPEVRRHPDNARVPVRLQRYWDRSNDPGAVPPGSLEVRKGQFRTQLRLTGLLHRAGVRLLAGTDSPVQYCPPGFSLHQELELLVDAGLSPSAALQAATLHGATALKEDHHLGSIEEGKLADMVLLDANPLKDIRNTRKIGMVIRSGQILMPHEILQRAPRE